MRRQTEALARNHLPPVAIVLIGKRNELGCRVGVTI